MSLVTLEIGPTWKMQLLCDWLAEHGVPAFVADSNLKTIDPLITGAMSFDARLQIPAEAVELARTALAARALAEEAEAETISGLGLMVGSRLAEARAEAEELEAAGEDAEPEDPWEPPAPGPDLEALADLGRRIRWAALLFWMHPFLFVYGVRYLRWLPRVGGRPAGHGLTLTTLVVVGLFWGALFYGVLRYGL